MKRSSARDTARLLAHQRALIRALIEEASAPDEGRARLSSLVPQPEGRTEMAEIIPFPNLHTGKNLG